MQFEFLPAFKGDCFLIHAGTKAKPVLILVDGGPSGTYKKHLRPRLMELRGERGLDDFTPLVIDLVIVSHVDDDHVNGLIELFRELFENAKAGPAGEPPKFEVRGLWHNSFDEVIGNNEVVDSVGQFGAASFVSLFEEAETQEQHDAGLILQSIAQGHELRDLASSQELQIPLNDGFAGLIQTTAGKATKRRFGGITFTVLGPRAAELKELQEAQDEWLEAQRKKGKPVTAGSLLQSLTDESVANLSSIVLLAEKGKRKVLLTGDARSDFIVKGLEESGLLKTGKSLAVDLLKMPHHGSDRNVDEAFLARVTAPRYLFTGDGEHGNPERETFEMIAKARPGAAMEFYLTYPVAQIDAERKHEHDHERDKEVRKKAAGRFKGKPRAAWSDKDHSLAALIKSFPATIKVIEPTGPIVKL
jgi:beta-lactamase superfamily II metal-dependent hydrolase